MLSDCHGALTGRRVQAEWGKGHGRSISGEGTFYLSLPLAFQLSEVLLAWTFPFFSPPLPSSPSLLPFPSPPLPFPCFPPFPSPAPPIFLSPAPPPPFPFLNNMTSKGLQELSGEKESVPYVALLIVPVHARAAIIKL